MNRKKCIQGAALLLIFGSMAVLAVRDELYFAPARREQFARQREYYHDRSVYMGRLGRDWDSLTGSDHYQLALITKRYRLYGWAIGHLNKADQKGCRFDTSRVRAACESGLAGGSDEERKR